MKILSKRFGIIAFAAIIALAIAGCGGGPTVESVSIDTDGGESSIKTGDMLGFSATVTGKNKPSQDVIWSVSSSNDGSGSIADETKISSSGFLTVDEKETASTLYVKAVSKQDPSKFNSKPIKVEVVAVTDTTAPKPKATVTAVTVSPESPTLKRRDTANFAAKVTGANNPSQNVTWKVSRNLDGSGDLDKKTQIDAKGELTVNGEKGEFYVIAISSVDNKKIGSTKVSIGKSNNPAESLQSAVESIQSPADSSKSPDSLKSVAESIQSLTDSPQSTTAPAAPPTDPLKSLAESIKAKKESE